MAYACRTKDRIASKAEKHFTFYTQASGLRFATYREALVVPIEQKSASRSSDRPVLNSPHGFTLIELMVVVGIIGILVSITGPLYNRYQRKARQSEAKIALSSMYSLEKAFYSEYAAYVGSLDAIGYSADGARRFYNHNIVSDLATVGTVTGYAGVYTTPSLAQVNTPFTLKFTYPAGNCVAANTMAGAQYVNDSQIFAGFAQGNLGTSYDDVWTINYLKTLANCSNGI